MQIKTAPVRVKAGPDDGLADGEFLAYASTFTREPDSYGDVVKAGAFAATIADWSAKDAVLPVLWGHNMSDPDFNIGSVIEATEDEHGLLVKGLLDMESPKAQQVYRLIKGKRVTQLSFAFDVLDSAQVTEGGQKVNELRELKLYEVSIVPIGANQETEVLAVKVAADSLTSGLKAGRALSAKNESELRTAHAAIGNVLAAIDGDDDQEKASGHAPANDEEPPGVKSEEPKFNPSARALAELTLTALNGAQEGV